MPMAPSSSSSPASSSARAPRADGAALRPFAIGVASVSGGTALGLGKPCEKRQPAQKTTDK